MSLSPGLSRSPTLTKAIWSVKYIITFDKGESAERGGIFRFPSKKSSLALLS